MPVTSCSQLETGSWQLENSSCTFQEELKSLAWVAAGITAGSLAAVAAARALEGFLSQRLFELPPGDWLSLGLATLMLLVVAGGAAYLPARRAWRIDPQLALRYE